MYEVTGNGFIRFDNPGDRAEFEHAVEDDTYIQNVVRTMDDDDIRILCMFALLNPLGRFAVNRGVLWRDRETGEWNLNESELAHMTLVAKTKVIDRLNRLVSMGVLTLQQKNGADPVWVNQKALTYIRRKAAALK